MKYKVGDLLYLKFNTTIWDLSKNSQDCQEGQIFIVSSQHKDINVFVIYNQQDCSFSEWHPDQVEKLFMKL